MNLSSKDVDSIIEKIKFHKSEVDSCGDIAKANNAFGLAMKKMCEIIYTKRFDLFKSLVKNKDITIVDFMTLFLLPISEKKTFGRLFKLFFLRDYSLGARTLWREYKSGCLRFPRLLDNTVVYVSKEEYLEQFKKDEKKLISSFL